VHGLQHREPEAVERAERLHEGEPLRIESDPNNVADSLAVKTLTDDEQPRHIGFLPRYLNADVHHLGLHTVRATVARVNPRPVPLQFRVLVRLVAPWPEDFRAFSDSAFQPLASTHVTLDCSS